MKRLWLATGLVVLGGLLVLLLAWPGESSRKKSDANRAAMPRAEAVTRAAPSDDVIEEDDVRGTLRLEGQVVDAETRPVAGAVVAIDTRPERTALTEADGSFAFEGLVGREYTVVATAGEQVAGPAVVELGASTDPVVLRLRPGAAAHVAVVTARGRAPIAGARVELRGVVDREAVADHSGKATFHGVPPGIYRLVASHTGYARTTTLAAVDHGTSSYRLELVTGILASGRVVDPADRPVAGARVTYEGVSDWANASSDSVTTGTDGTFQIEGLAPGSFRFTARHDDFAAGASDPVVLAGAPRDGIRIRLGPAAVLTGSVVDKHDRPVAWAKVRVAEEMAGLQLQRTRQTRTDANGRFELAGLHRKRTHVVALGERSASATATIELDDRDRAEVKLVLDLDAAIEGIAVDTAGEPLEGARIVAEPDQPGAPIEARLRGVQHAVTSADGKFALRGVGPGRYKLRASPPGALEHARNTLRETIVAAAGDRAVRIVVPADGSIAGRVTFADGRTPAAFVVSLGGWGQTIPVAARDGSFSIADVPPRTYQLAIRGAGFAERTVTGVVVAPGKAADLGTITVQAGRTISGRVVDGAGAPIAGAKVLAGPILWGTGSTARAPAGVGGPPGSGAIQEATTSEAGVFTLTGIGRGPRHLIAEHDTLGRSLPVTVATPTSASGVELVLAPLGALEGTVTSAGKPAARVIINAQSKTVPEAMFSVISGADGAYRFDRLTPDRYLVTAMVGEDPMRGFAFHGRSVSVAPGATARANLAIDAGTIALHVTPRAGRPVTFAIVEIVEGTASFRTYDELKRYQVARESGASSFAMSFGGKPAQLASLSPGRYTACAMPLPDEVGALGSMDYLMREGDTLPVFCKPVEVTAAPDEQAVAIDVKIPAFVPAED